LDCSQQPKPKRNTHPHLSHLIEMKGWVHQGWVGYRTVLRILYQYKDLRAAGFTGLELRDAGFQAHEVAAGGYGDSVNGL
jgi:hypothetical protein